ncbi:PH domain-containing protein [Streptomyces sp. NBC_00320]|uniref:PH domain-containing protein n=1 Tax=unclassified Streptomyces TaxID=2593676 RepID=UPI0022531CB0|nr:PH domain-containing protein [Streptomyces sp. NBC_00320]MCX5146142.1 PH domain-containing protein [Streptomyces sp. NBC_00320]
MGARGTAELPRKYRVNGRKLVTAAAVIGVAMLGLLVEAWTEEDFPAWLRWLLSVLALAMAGTLATVPRTATMADRTGLTVQGPIRTRRLAWSEIEDIRAEPLRAPAIGARPSLTPSMLMYAYPADGRRRLLLMNLNDLHHDVDRELAVLRAAWTELRDAGPSGGAPRR